MCAPKVSGVPFGCTYVHNEGVTNLVPFSCTYLASPKGMQIQHLLPRRGRPVSARFVCALCAYAHSPSTFVPHKSSPHRRCARTRNTFFPEGDVLRVRASLRGTLTFGAHVLGFPEGDANTTPSSPKGTCCAYAHPEGKKSLICADRFVSRSLRGTVARTCTTEGERSGRPVRTHGT